MTLKSAARWFILALIVSLQAVVYQNCSRGFATADGSDIGSFLKDGNLAMMTMISGLQSPGLQCASEGVECTFAGTQEIRYGANGVYTTGTFTNSVGCTNETFGDPLPGVVKACYVAPAVTASRQYSPGSVMDSLSWSFAGPVAGKICTLVNEPADPDAWADNYLCSTDDLGLRWSYAGPIAGMVCTQINEPSDAHTWADNYLCAPQDYRFKWSFAGPIAGLPCLQVNEPSDPDAWSDNYLCAGDVPSVSDGGGGSGSGGGSGGGSGSDKNPWLTITPNQIVTISNKAYKLCLDVPGASRDAGVMLQAYPCNGTGAQSFRTIFNADATQSFQNTNSGFCLEVGDGNRIYQQACTGSDLQRFRLSANATDVMGFMTTRGLGITEYGSELQMTPFRGGDDQYWRLSPAR